MKKILLAFAMVGFISAIHAQTILFEDDFEAYSPPFNTGDGNFIPPGYTSYDVNGNGKTWGMSNPDFWTQPIGDIYSGNFMISATYLQSGESIYAENILVLPAITIPAGSENVTLNYYVGSGTDTGYYAETYEVIITTENSQAAILAATPIFSETLPSQGGFDRTINLDAYAGQTIYISFFHTDSFDKWILGLDNIVVTAEEGSGGPTYCDIIDLDCAVEHINSVVFAGISNLNTGCGTAAGNDFTDMMAEVVIGQTYEMLVNISADSSFPDDNAFFFIDWNQNGILDDAGEVYEIVMHTGTSGDYTVDVTVPDDAVLGQTRLRVGIAYNSSTTFEPLACPGDSTLIYGEYEDYSVNVTTDLGISDVSGKLAALYPNPVLESFKLSLSDKFNIHNMKVTITDMRGKTVKTFGATDSYNVSDLAAGIYVVRITDGKYTETKKIVKK
jgi:hypothetical protein